MTDAPSQTTPKARTAMIEWLDEEIEAWKPDPISTTLDAVNHYSMLQAIRDYIWRTIPQ